MSFPSSSCKDAHGDPYGLGDCMSTLHWTAPICFSYCPRIATDTTAFTLKSPCLDNNLDSPSIPGLVIPMLFSKIFKKWRTIWKALDSPASQEMWGLKKKKERNKEIK